jgi:hypothetical protein
MSLKFENSRRDYESRPVCMDLNPHGLLRNQYDVKTPKRLMSLCFAVIWIPNPNHTLIILTLILTLNIP